MKFRNLVLPALGVLFFSFTSFAQTTALEGEVKGEDGKGLQGALVKIERRDIKGNYKVKTDKRGRFIYAGLPLGTYKLTIEVDGTDRDSVDNVRTTLGDPKVVNFDLQVIKKKQDALQKAAETGTLTQEQAREMSSEAREAYEKQLKERAEAMKKDKALNDAYSEGMTALQAKNYDLAVTSFEKAGEMSPKQHVIWAQLAEAYIQQAGTKTGADQEAVLGKGIQTWQKTLELKPDDAAYHNNFALALVKAKKIPEAEAELKKAAELAPAQAGQYYYNLGAVMTNSGQSDAAAQAFQQAIAADPNYAEAYYQYGLSLMAKAQIAADGKITPAPGTKEALEKYLQLKPDGQNAQSAKDLLATMTGSIDTSYKNPNAPADSKKGKKK